MLSQMSRKKAIWGNQESKQPVCMCNITIAVHTLTSFYLNLLSSGICTQLLCSLGHRQSKSHRQTDYIDFSILILVNKSSCNTGNFLGKSTKKNTSQNFLTPKKSQNYWFQTPQNLKFGLAIDAGIYFKRDLWGTAVIRSLTYFLVVFSVLFLLFPEPSYSGPDEVHFFRGPALDVSKHFIYLFIYWFSKHNINYKRQGCCLRGAWLLEAPTICSWVTKI